MTRPASRAGTAARGLAVALLALVGKATTARAFQAGAATAPCVTDTLLLKAPAAWVGTDIGTLTVNRGGINLPTPHEGRIRRGGSDPLR